MPNSNIKAYAKRSGKSVKQVEKIWDETVLEAKKKFPKDEWEKSEYWAYVNATVMFKLGIRTHKKKT